MCHFRFIYVIKAGKFLEILDISNGKKLLIKYQSASMAANISLRAMNFIYSFTFLYMSARGLHGAKEEPKRHIEGKVQF